MEDARSRPLSETGAFRTSRPQGIGGRNIYQRLGEMFVMARTTYLVDDDDGVRKAFRSLLELQPNQIVRDFRDGETFLAEAGSLEPGVLLL